MFSPFLNTPDFASVPDWYRARAAVQDTQDYAPSPAAPFASQ